MSPCNAHQVPPEPVPDNDPLPDEEPAPDKDPVPDHNPVSSASPIDAETQTGMQFAHRPAFR